MTSRVAKSGQPDQRKVSRNAKGGKEGGWKP